MTTFLSELFSVNRASTTVSSGGTSAPSGGTQETWTVASSAQFGAAATGISQFHVADPASPTEIIAVTNVSGTTWTVTRGAESSTPVTHVAGFTVYQVTSAAFLNAAVSQGSDGHIWPSFTPRPTLYSPTGLRTWRAAFGDALFSQIPIVCVGDSITAGVGGDNIDAFSNVPDNSNGWVGQLRALFATNLGSYPGEGFWFADDSRVTLGGGVSSGNWSCVPLRHGPRMLHGNGWTLQVTIPSGITSCGVIQANETQAFSAAGSNLQDVSANYAQTGSVTVATTAITTLTNTGLPIETDIACQPGDVITISSPATAQSYIVGFNMKTAQPGVLVHRIGQGGYVSGDMLGGQSSGTLLQSASPSNQVTAARACYYWAGPSGAANTPTGLVIVSFGTNDQQFQQGGGTANQNDVTLSLYTTWMEQFCNQAITDGWCCLILGEPRNAAPGSGATLDQYWGAMKSYALATDNVAFIDVGELWGAPYSPEELGLLATGSTIHPSRRGHGDIARMLYNAITGVSGITELAAA